MNQKYDPQVGDLIEIVPPLSGVSRLICLLIAYDPDKNWYYAQQMAPMNKETMYTKSYLQIYSRLISRPEDNEQQT